MKCIACGEEIALAKVCPYCGKAQAPRAEEGARQEPRGGEAAQGRPRGRFRGSMEPGGGAGTAEKLTPSLENVMRFLLHPRIAPWRKGIVFAALFYLLSPLDMLPGAILPGVGWLDDLGVLLLAWRYIAAQLRAAD